MLLHSPQIVVVLLYIAGAVLVSLALIRVVRKFYKFPAPAFLSGLFDSRWRLTLQPPERIVDRSGIKQDMRAVEIGCGPGTYTVTAARIIGPEGELHAIDIQPAMIEKINARLKERHNRDIQNVETKVASAYKLPCEDGSVDVVYMIASLSEIPDRQAALREIRRVLKENGILAVSEFFPDPDYPLKRTVKRWCRRAGYTLTKARGNFFDYTLQFRKAQ